MPKFESQLTNKSFQGQAFRDVEVPDASGYQAPSQNPLFQNQQVRPPPQHNVPDLQEIERFQSQMQGYEVPNHDSGLAEAERQFQQARKDKLLGQTQLNDGARKRIEMLIGMTRLTRAVEIEGNTYTLQTLKGKEMREAIMEAATYDGTVQSPFEIRKQMLARSTHIAGVEIAQFVGSNTFQARLELIDELDDILLNRLMDEYSVLNKEAKDKYAIQQVGQAQEVAEDLKK